VLSNCKCMEKTNEYISFDLHFIYIFFLYYFSIPINISILQLLCLLYAIYIRDRIFKKNAN